MGILAASAEGQTFGPALTPGGIHGTTRDERWSPLHEPVPHGRGVFFAPLMGQSVLDRPHVGLFWTAGLAGALPFELPAPRASLAVARRQASGDLRRPLDPEESSATSVAGLAWQPIGARGFGLGRASLDLTTASPTLAVLTNPYRGSPFVLTDTSGPEMQRPVASIEGVAAWRLGSFGIGGSAGLATSDTRSARARNARTGRVGIPAATVSAVGQFGKGILLVGLYARARSFRETGHSVPVTAPGRIYHLQGYSEPEPVDIGLPAAYYRRIESTYIGLGGAIGGSLLGTRWTAFLEKQRNDEKQRTAQRRDAPLDRWKTRGIAAGAAAQRTFVDTTLILTADVRYESMDGEATRPDLNGFIYLSEDRALAGAFEVRYARPGSRLDGTLRLALEHSNRTQLDALAELETEFDAWTWRLGGGIGWRMATAVHTRLGYTVSRYTPASVIPADSGLGPVQRQLILPELEYAARMIVGHDARAMISWDRTPGTSHWLSLGYGIDNARDAFFGPASRSSLSVSLGVTLR